MIILVTLGGMLALAVGLGVATAIRDRRSGRVDQNMIDADKARSLTITHIGGRSSSGEYLPPPDDGRPSH